jgi:hypothetical protein
MRVEAARGVVAVRVGAVFQARECEELERRLAALAPMRRLVVDFSDTREADDSAVAQLAASLRGLSPSVSLHGLSLHHRRVLRFLGLWGPDGELPFAGSLVEREAAP